MNCRVSDDLPDSPLDPQLIVYKKVEFVGLHDVIAGTTNPILKFFH